jgi:hypothetical protein
VDHRLICEWLHLPADAWPPDPCRLLGIDEASPTQHLLDERVHERMEIVRRYQLAHPEECTEAMNRLAQAYVALAPRSEPSLNEQLLVLEAESARTELGKEGTRTSSDPSVRTVAPVPLAAPALPAQRMEPVPQAPQTAAESSRIDPFRSRPPANRRSIYHRLARVRRLLRAWRGLEEALGDPAWRVARPADAASLIQRCAELAARARSLPAGVGSAGEPGYLVMALARQQVVVPTFQSLLPGQREALARDWAAGMTNLEQQLGALRTAARAVRKRFSPRLAAAGTMAWLSSHPGLILLLIACIALLIAGWRTIGR